MSNAASIQGFPAGDGVLRNEPRAPARLMEYKRGSFVAFPAHTTMGLVDRPPVIPVPGAPYYCLGLVEWEGRQLPLLDLNVLLRAYATDEPAPVEHVLVLAWQRGPGEELDYGAVCAPLLVRMVEVADSQQCELPGTSDLWPFLSLSCFLVDQKAVPVLDTSRLFGRPHS